MSKPREYKILIDQHGIPFETKKSNEDFINCDYSFERKTIHVVDKQKYDRLEKAAMKLRKASKDASDFLNADKGFNFVAEAFAIAIDNFDEAIKE